MASSTSALVTIPDVTLLHIPAPGQEPVTLAKGELTLTALPDQVLALSGESVCKTMIRLPISS